MKRHWLDAVVKDLRFALRIFLRSPGFTAVSILTLGLGIGAATAIFTVVDSMLLRPLPFPAPERLVWIRNRIPTLGGVLDDCRMSQFIEWHSRATSFEILAAYHAFFTHQSYNFTGRGEPERLTGIEVSQSFFPLLGAKPVLGRLFREGEDLPGAARVVVLSYELWQRRFGASPDIAGETLVLNDRHYTVVGVLPRGFRFTSTFVPGADIDLYAPLVRDPRLEMLGNYLAVVGRLRPNASLEQARAELTALNQGLAPGNAALKSFVPALIPLSQHVAGPVRSTLQVLLATVAFVLLAGCANLANLFLARATSRTREIGVRLALGAGRGRLVRQLLTESFAIALSGGVLGVALAAACLRRLRYAGSLRLPRLAEVQLDAPVLLFALALCLVTSLLFGLAPALHSTRVDLTSALKESGQWTTSAPRRQRLRSALVAVQIALALVLLVGAGLLIRSFHRLLDENPGFRPEHVLAMRLDVGGNIPQLPVSNFRAGRPLNVYLEEAAQRVAALPGVESAAIAYNLPLDRNMRWEAAIQGKQYPSGATDTASVRFAGPGYFRTMGIPLIAGRDFDAADERGKPYVVIVNQKFGRRIATVRDPLQATLAINGRLHRVIGIVSDVRHEGLHREPDTEIYLAFTQRPLEIGFTGFDLVVKTRVDPASIAPRSAARSGPWTPTRPSAA